MSIRPGTLLAASVLVLGSGACLISNPTPPPEGESSQPATITPTPLPPSTTAPLPTVPPGVPTQELSSIGPWIVFPDDDGIWGLNEDGTGLSLLSRDQLFEDAVIPSPTGGLFAYLTKGPTGDPRDTILHIYSIPLRQEIASIPVAPAYTEPDSEDPEWYRGYSAGVAVNQSPPPLAWSPDGSRLAFVGILDGESADLYAYSIETREVARLSSGPSQAFEPSWSPDGEYILHFGVGSFCCGAGYTMDGAWASLADGSRVVVLEDVELVSGAWVLGWHATDPKAYVESWGASCGPISLQEVNVATGEVAYLWPDWVTDVSLDRGGAGLILIGSEECESEPTMMMISPTHEVRTIPLAGATAVDWLRETRPDHPTYAVASNERGQFLIAAQGDVLSIASPAADVGLPSQMPGTDLLLWAGGDGLWMGSLTDMKAAPVKVLDGEVYDVFPSADADELVIVSIDGLWVASRADEYRPRSIGEGRSLHAVRVEP